jgi:DNA repair protein RadC
MSKQITAKRTQRAIVGRDAWVYELSAPVHYEQRGEKLSTNYVVVLTFWNDDVGKPSVVIYPSDESGSILSYSELPGSHIGDADHEKAIREAGWTLDPKSVKRTTPSAEELRDCVGIHTHAPVNVPETVRAAAGPPHASEHAETEKPGVPTRAIVTNQGMMKGYWKVSVVDAEGREVEVVERVQSKKLAQQWADEINNRGSYTTGISGARYEQRLGQPLHQPTEREKEYQWGEAREDTAPVIYEAGAERGGKEHVTTTVVGEPGPKGDCLPWVRVTRDPERYEACLAQAQKIGPIDNSRKVYDLLVPMFAKEDQEILVVVLVDVRRQLRGVAEVHRGQRSSVGVSVADVLRVVITTGAEGFVLSHGHPSGKSSPSKADVELTKQIAEATKPYGKSITFIGHVVIGTGEYSEISASGEVSKAVKVKG